MIQPPFDPDDIQIRPMSQVEALRLVQWAQQEGWNPGRNDASIFWNFDPQAFIAAEFQGELIGGGSIAAYGADFGFMGLFIVREEFRGHGLGRKLWLARRDRLRERLAPGASIGMDGVEAMVPFYERGGFRKSHQNRRFEFTGRAAPVSDELIPANQLDFQQVADFDREHFPAARDPFLRSWLHQPGAVSLAKVDHGRIVGLGVMRPCTVGFKVGPLYAADVEIAGEILSALQSNAIGQPVSVDIPDTNPDGRKLVDRFGMREVFSCARMYLGSAPQVKDHQIFGITTFELG